jgi:predicted TIM-barrel fold metal-dependent hydrolase
MRKLILLFALAFVMAACTQQPAKKAAPSAQAASPVVQGPFSEGELARFTALEPIDSHAHVFQSNPAFYAMLDRLHVHLIDICVNDDHDPFLKNLPREIRADLAVVHASDGHVSFCTTFDPFKFRERGFAQGAIRQINRNFAQGAIAVKIWKNIGMELKDSKGNYILPDNPVFEPIYKDIAAHNKTLIAHVADPSTLWQPPNPNAPDYSYYMKHPEWYMYNKPHPASKQAILKARDHILEENPNLRMVGAHLGSMENDFGELAQHLDRYPNFAVDMAARMPYVMMQPHAKIIAFLTKYQDRLIYGTDLELFPGQNVQDAVKNWEDYYARDWRFLATNDTVEYHGQKFRGLDLPEPVLRQIYHNNALKWFPGVGAAQ